MKLFEFTRNVWLLRTCFSRQGVKFSNNHIHESHENISIAVFIMHVLSTKQQTSIDIISLGILIPTSPGLKSNIPMQYAEKTGC